MWTYQINETTNGVQIFCDGELKANQPFNSITGENFTKEEAVEWAEDYVQTRNLISQNTQ